MKDLRFTEREADELLYMLRNTNSTLLLSARKKIQNSKKKIKVSSAKGKGRELQYYVCKHIASLFGIEFVQSDDECLVHSREMGQHGTDIVLRGEVAKKLPYAIECKNCEQMSVPQWVEQARANTPQGKEWVLIMKKKSIGTEPVVLISFKHWIELIEEKIK